MSFWSQILLQESNSMTMQLLSLFHDYSLGIIMMILVFVSFLSASIISNTFLSDSVIVSIVEVVWTLLPMLILIGLVVPSLQILYTMEEDEAYVNLKVMGFQWYWSYDYNEFGVEYDSYMEPNSEYRLLDVDHRAVLPLNKNIRGIITAADVIHCWALPSAGVKVDAVPGRLNQLFINFIRPLVCYGQCSEICGANHSFMPIGVEAVSPQNYFDWVSILGTNWQSSKSFSIFLTLVALC